MRTHTQKALDVDVRSRERSRERSTPLSSTTAAATKAVDVHVLSSVKVVSGRSQKRPRKVKFSRFFLFFFLLPPRQGKVGISSVRFFSRQRRREHERAPPLKKLKITHAALRSNEETRDSRSKLLFIRIKFFTRARHKNDASRDGGLGNARVRRNAGHVR